MKRSLTSLKKEAATAASWRGHLLGPWEQDGPSFTALANCSHPGCQAWVQVCQSPAPNGIEVGGPAVAINCGWRKPA